MPSQRKKKEKYGFGNGARFLRGARSVIAEEALTDEKY